MDGTKDHLIQCFKEIQLCANGLGMLKEQGATESAVECRIFKKNPFEIMESDTEEANTNNDLIDLSDFEDNFIDIEL